MTSLAIFEVPSRLFPHFSGYCRGSLLLAVFTLHSLVISIGLPLSLWANDAHFPDCESHRVGIGPSVYHLRRDRDGGSSQDGYLGGISIYYERIKPYGFYWSFEGSLAQGSIYGRSGGGSPLESVKRDTEVEGHLGYAFYPWGVFLTPFVGAGYFNGLNDFVSPSPMTIQYHNRFRYISLGLQGERCVSEKASLGFRIAIKYMTEGKSRISQDPMFEDAHLIVENRFQWYLDFPITIKWRAKKHLALKIAPLLRWRHYGGRENFPFDFYETDFRLIGINFFMVTHS